MTFVFTGVFVPLQIVISLFLAVPLNLRVFGMRVIRTIYYLPSILPAVVTGLVWVGLVNPDFGLLNLVIFKVLGIRGPNWLGSQRWVMPAVIISGLWGMGAGVIILLAALQSVPPRALRGRRAGRCQPLEPDHGRVDSRCDTPRGVLFRGPELHDLGHRGE